MSSATGITSTVLLLFSLAVFVHCLPSADGTSDGRGKAIKGLGERSFCTRGQGRPPNRVNSTEQVNAVRRAMSVAEPGWPELAALIVTTADEHQTEFVHDRDKLVQWVSGFSGSMGLVVITKRHAILWTDGRYEAQADEEVDCQWTILHTSSEQTQTVDEWLASELPQGVRVGADPTRVPSYIWSQWNETLITRGIKLTETRENIILNLWGSKRPHYPERFLFPLNIEYTGVSWENKVKDLREELKKEKADAMVVTALDEISWLLNIRGKGYYPYNPFVKAYVLVTPKEISLYIDTAIANNTAIREFLKINECTQGNLECVRIRDYNKIFDDLKTQSQVWERVLLPSRWSFSSGASQKIVESVKPSARLQIPSPLILPKSIKNEDEIKGMMKAHVQDGVAMCEFLYKIERQFPKTNWTELNVANELSLIRRSQINNRGLSFATIVGYGSHGALPHYVPTNLTNRLISNTSTLVLDSGGHYMEGTTDVTRTLHFGEPTDFQKEAYTRVLKGQIRLAMLVFPENLKVSQLEPLARGPLWQIGLDYRHGTGHGIGAYNSVHESPICIHSSGSETLNPGQFFSDEPGYYHDKHFGVRLENILLVEKQNTKYDFDGPYLGFKTVTLVPYEPKLIKFELLTVPEIRWLNEYNNQIRKQVGQILKSRYLMGEFHWLLEKTKYIPERSSSARLSSGGVLLFALAFISIWSSNNF